MLTFRPWDQRVNYDLRPNALSGSLWLGNSTHKGFNQRFPKELFIHGPDEELPV